MNLLGRNKIELSHVAFEVTSRCNLDCRYCYNPWKRPDGAHATGGSYARAIRTLKRLFKMARVSQLTLTGGEPLIAERVLETVLYCRLRGATVAVITNGSGASPGDYRALIDLGVNLFELPVHSPEPGAHDTMTRKPGSWQCSLQSIREIQDLGARAVAVIVITDLNASRVADTLAFVRDRGVREIMLNRFNVGGRGVGERALLEPDHDTLQRAFAAANVFAAEHRDVRLTSNVCSPMCVLDPKEYRHIGFSACSNDPRRMPLTLGVDGDLRLCNHSPVVIGNIFEQSFEEMFASDYAHTWRDTVPELCQECRLWARCRGGCRAAGEQLDGDLRQPDPAVLPLSGILTHCRPGQ